MAEHQVNGSVQSANPTLKRVVESPKVWTTLITNTKYLSGLLTLHASLQFVESKYPLIALYTDTFPAEGHAALDARSIPKRRVDYLLPKVENDYTNDPRFYDCWSKLTPFSLVEYERVIQLDSDMLVLQNMDELMDIPLDSAEQAGKGQRVFAASHACVCNPLKRPHYPKNWIPSNCAFTWQHWAPEAAQTASAGPADGLAMPNGGLQVVVPSADVYDLILSRLQDPSTMQYDFADQSLLGDLFYGRWVALPYVYNALKTLRWEGVHAQIWRDDNIKNIHYILSPKPWDENEEDKRKEIGHTLEALSKGARDASNQWWWDLNERRRKEEKSRGIEDDF